MDDKTKKDFIHLFNEGFDAVVLPHIENLDKRLESVEHKLDKVDNRLEVVETRLDVVERKLDRVVANQLDDRGKQIDHEKRIKKLEASGVTT